MVEWAVVCSRPHDLDGLEACLSLETTRTGRLGELQTEAREAAEAAFGPPRFTRLYYGTEFCERLVPTVSQVRRAYEAAATRRLGVSLLTPYVTDSGLDRLRPVLDWLAALDDSSVEVVVNDWGTLRLLRRDFPGLRPLLGRLMNRLLRDPRIASEFAGPRAPTAAVTALQQSGVTAAVFRRFLNRHGITMVEFDNLFQGLDMNFGALGLSASLYIPYGYVATGRVCPIGSLRLPASQKFDVESPCRQECRLYTLRFEYSGSPFDNRDQEFFEQGNTYFYFQDRRMIASSAEMVERLGIRRIVYQPRLPM
jgi:hypothetical protein